MLDLDLEDELNERADEAYACFGGLREASQYLKRRYNEVADLKHLAAFFWVWFRRGVQLEKRDIHELVDIYKISQRLEKAGCGRVNGRSNEEDGNVNEDIYTKVQRAINLAVAKLKNRNNCVEGAIRNVNEDSKIYCPSNFCVNVFRSIV